MPPLRTLVLIAVLLTMMVACGDDGTSSPQGGGGQIEGPTWILDEASVNSLAPDVSDAAVTISFDAGSVGGTAGCNRYGGSYERGDDGSLSIEVGAMTQMACEETLMELETTYVVALGEVSSYQVDGEVLTLEREGGAPLTFDAEQAVPLEGTVWHLDGIASGTDAVSSTVAGSKVSATFDGKGGVSGSGGCNRYSGSYETDGSAIAISGVVSTKMSCPDQAISDQEAAYFAALGEVAAFTIEGSTFTLSDADGGFLLSFVGGPA